MPAGLIAIKNNEKLEKNNELKKILLISVEGKLMI